jgi:hypothetical protein
MVDILGKTILIEAIKESIKGLIGQVNNGTLTQAKRERLSEALTSLQFASIKTRNFIDNKGYEPNMNLVELWNKALNNSIKAGLKDLPDYLHSKSKFWGNPQDWLNEPASMELVPKLNFINEQCEMLLIQLKK